MRIEIKYYLESKDVNKIVDFANKFGVPDNHSENGLGYEVCSTYIHSWIDNTRKLKGKLRLRKYTTNNNSSYFIEEKIKYNIWSLKNRCNVSEIDFQNLKSVSNTKELRKYSCISELKFFNLSSFEDSLFNLDILYYRLAWNISWQNIDFRLTIDKNLRCCVHNEYKNMVSPEFYILEIKGSENMFFLQDAFFELFDLWPSKISKYSLGKKQLGCGMRI